MSLDKEKRYFTYIRKGKTLFNEEKYHQSAECLREGLKYAEDNKILPWNLRWRLADVYEAMGDRENFVKEIDWLIAHCQNEKTKQQFIERKQKFLASHPDKS